MSTQNAFTTIDTTDLDTVTGGSWAFVRRAAIWAAGLFGGGGGGGGGDTNVTVQNGSNNRSASGNSGTVSMGDNSPIHKGGQ